MSMADIPGIAHTPSSGHQGTPAHAEMEPEGTLPLTPGGGGVCELALIEAGDVVLRHARRVA